MLVVSPNQSYVAACMRRNVLETRDLPSDVRRCLRKHQLAASLRVCDYKKALIAPSSPEPAMEVIQEIGCQIIIGIAGRTIGERFAQDFSTRWSKTGSILFPG